MTKEHCERFNLNWLDHELKNLSMMLNLHDFTHDFLSQKKLPKLKDVLEHMISYNMVTRSNWLAEDLDISRRTAQKYLKRLCYLRWLMRGRWVTFTDINPFLQLLIYLSPKETGKVVSSYAPKQIDLLKLFASPLLRAVDEKVNNVEIIWSQHEPTWGMHFFSRQGYYPRLYPYFNGTIQIKIETDERDFYATLPYNIHWTGRNCHITLPIPFEFYGVESCSYSKGKLKVHFDNSVSVGIPLGSASYTSRQLLRQWGQTHWSDMSNRFLHKYWKNEYVECFSFETHEEILKQRLYNKTIPTKQASEKKFLLKQFLAELD